ncbi:inversin-B-like isoform X2 [Stegodyphus dumicola]|uniref:inversin-B-like isoform X2 n=1 Tax=Stegodyphus dumicola TaxID=202533 RepID=UPI0015A91541|nr:inversin-B-like isoform X2 [Stegodyphus dumicola]
MELKRNKRAQRSQSPSHTSLMLACQQEAKEDVRNIIQRQPGAALQRDRTGKNALHYCAENTDVDCASLVLSVAPTLLNAPDEEGYSPLHLAVISGNKSIVKYLLTRGADCRAVDSEKHSCVHWATVSGDLECLDLLINAGADPSTPDIHGAYPVHYAAQMCGPNSEMGNDVRVGLAVLTKLLSRGVDVSCVDRDGRPPLLWAASGGSSDAILALVKSGADVNAADRDGLTALHCAASRGHVDCLETLLTLCGAEIDRVDDNGCTALFYAVTLGHADCTNLLLSFGSNPDKQDHKGRTPAHCGASKGQLETLKILTHHKANLWLRNSKGDMPLHEAVQSGRKDLVEWLLQQHKGSVNVSNANGRTPLHIAAITNNVDMCKVLMDYGAFINPIMRNSKGQQMTPLDAALHRGNRGCAKYLNLHGALPASKLLEKREYNRFTETHLSETLELSPNTRQRLLRDTSAQTEPQLRDVDIQAVVEQRNVGAVADLTRGQTPINSKSSCASTSIRCAGEDGSGKPIIAKVYVHTKRSKIRRLTRKPTAYRRDYQGEKLCTRQQQRLNSNAQNMENGSSNDKNDTETPRETDLEKDVSSRKASQPTLYEKLEETAKEEVPQLSSEEKEFRPETSEQNGYTKMHQCSCYSKHEVGTETCDCDCHVAEERLKQLSVEQNRRSLRAKDYDTENHSPMSSIRSFESTIKDSGFSDDVDRGHREEMSSSDDDRGGHSDSETRTGKRKRRHIARYVVSSGAAETFRLEDEEDEAHKTIIKPRSSSLPHLRKKDNKFETCPRLLNRPTITKEVQKSLKKYQMERRLFYELQELKRKQITTTPHEEKEMVTKMVERFRNYVLSPPLSDYQGPLTFRSFEKYLYEQLRKLSMGGKIPKPKTNTKDISERTYVGPITKNDTNVNHVLCMCDTHKCHHTAQQHSDLMSDRQYYTRIPSLPEIARRTDERKGPQSRILVNRSKSWDRLEDGSTNNSTFSPCPGKLGNIHTSNSLPALSNPFPRRVPAALLAAISERLGPDVHPDDTIVVEMSADNVTSKMRHAFTVQEMKEVVSRYEEQAGRKVKPVPLETVLDPDDDGPITFEIRHGKERNIFRLPAGKLKDNKKWFLHYCLWPVGRYILPLNQMDHTLADDIRWEEIRLSPRAVLMLPPNFWT